MTILVTGGAGYIGSHVVRQLVAGGKSVVVIDNLSRGHRAAVSEQATFHQVDINDTNSVTEILSTERIEAVVHFAAMAYVGESVREPLQYYRSNTGGTLSLLESMCRAKVHRIVFSSSCATYGIPVDIPIRETASQQPINPYGNSKLFAEQLLRDTAVAHPQLGFVALRYFNVAGCASDGSLGEDHRPETHLIPLALLAALGRRDRLQIYGTDYATPDGTCIRDYVHVDDLATAHIQALDSLAAGDQRFYNLGIGHGYSVRQVIESVERVTGHGVPHAVSRRRPGDPPELLACAELANQELDWTPKFLDLDAIVHTAYRWFHEHPQGYGEPG